MEGLPAAQLFPTTSSARPARARAWPLNRSMGGGGQAGIELPCLANGASPQADAGALSGVGDTSTEGGTLAAAACDDGCGNRGRKQVPKAARSSAAPKVLFFSPHTIPRDSGSQVTSRIQLCCETRPDDRLLPFGSRCCDDAREFPLPMMSGTFAECHARVRPDGDAEFSGALPYGFGRDERGG